VKNAYDFPGFVPAYIRPCSAKDAVRSAGSRSRRSIDIAITDDLVLELFPENRSLRRWIELARKRIKFQDCLRASAGWDMANERDLGWRLTTW